ncbi:MAG: OsmC family protein [Chloroflexi bacterium]|nr:OsmC family protein [Chloroflexota bacterium]
MSAANPREVNGVNLEDFEASVQAIATQPQARHAPKTSRIQWLGGFKFRSFVRNHTFVVDEPAHLTGEDTAPNSMEYVLGAYGACLATGFVLNASRAGLTIYNLEVALDSQQNNVFTFLGVAEDGHSGFSTIRAKLFVQADAEEETLQRIWAHTVATSPVGNSLAHVVSIVPEIQVVP